MRSSQSSNSNNNKEKVGSSTVDENTSTTTATLSIFPGGKRELCTLGYTINKLVLDLCSKFESEVNESIVLYEDNNNMENRTKYEIIITHRYLDQAEYLVYRIPRYKPVPEFVINK